MGESSGLREVAERRTGSELEPKLRSSRLRGDLCKGKEGERVLNAALCILRRSEPDGGGREEATPPRQGVESERGKKISQRWRGRGK